MTNASPAPAPAGNQRAEAIKTDLLAVKTRTGELIDAMNKKIGAEGVQSEWSIPLVNAADLRSVEYRAALRAAIAFDDTVDYTGEIRGGRSSEPVVKRR